MAKLRHMAVVVPDLERSARFYESVFDMRRVGRDDLEIGSGIYLTDGTVNLALLQYKSAQAAGADSVEKLIGPHHFGFIVDSLEETQRRIERAGGRFFFDLGRGREDLNFERKFKDGDGIIFDISEKGWLGGAAAPSREIKEVFPYLRVKDAAAAIDFYARAFGAEEKFRLSEPSGRIGHAELALGGTTLMLSDEYPEHGIVGPGSTGGSGASIHLHVADADQMAAHAIAAGATMVREPADHFYGERSCTIRDPFGHEWLLGHEIERVSPEEMQRRFTSMLE